MENQADDTRNDAELLRLEANGVARAHRPRLTRSCLTVRQHRRIEALEASKHQILNAPLEHLLLRAALAECGIIREELLCSNRHSVLTFLSPHDLLLESFLFDQRSHPQGDSDGAGRLIVSVSEKAIGVGLTLLVVIVVGALCLCRLNRSVVWVGTGGHRPSCSGTSARHGWASSLGHRTAARLRVVQLRRLFLKIVHLII